MYPERLQKHTWNGHKGHPVSEQYLVDHTKKKRFKFHKGQPLMEFEPTTLATVDVKILCRNLYLLVYSAR